jgi:hypothetical protein
MSHESTEVLLQRPDPQHIQQLLEEFWTTLDDLPDLLPRQELLLASDTLHRLRHLVLEMMLALNGIAWPSGTTTLNTYLGASQQQAIHKTLLLSEVSIEGYIGQAVALTVIYRWYAPQLVDAHALHYPADLEVNVWQRLVARLPCWPYQVTTE